MFTNHANFSYTCARIFPLVEPVFTRMVGLGLEGCAPVTQVTGSTATLEQCLQACTQVNSWAFTYGTFKFTGLFNNPFLRNLLQSILPFF